MARIAFESCAAFPACPKGSGVRGQGSGNDIREIRNSELGMRNGATTPHSALRIPHLTLPFFLCLALASTLALLSTSCSKVEDAFSGLIGRVAIGPVEGAVVKVYDGSRFAAPDNEAGFIIQAVTDERGDFKAAIPDGYIGRTLIVVAEFPEDDPDTAQDERAFYLDFSDPAANRDD